MEKRPRERRLLDRRDDEADPRGRILSGLLTHETAVPKEFRSCFISRGIQSAFSAATEHTEHARWASDTPKRRAEPTERLRKMSKPV